MKYLILLLCKAMITLIRFLGLGGATSAPGLLASKLDKNILTKLTRSIPKGVIVVTGTNGKTTASRILATILKDSGLKVIQNRSGSNLHRGVITSLIENTTLLGRPIGDIAVFEVDEAASPLVIEQTSPVAVLVTNIFRDQLDRYGEIDKTARLIGAGLQKLRDSFVILNADDPMVTSLQEFVPSSSKAEFFGVNDISQNIEGDTGAIDARECIKCGAALNFKVRYFGHLGIYECPNGDLARPNPLIEIQNIKTLGAEGSSMTAVVQNSPIKIDAKLPGLYSVYNIAAAIAVAHLFGIKPEIYQKSVEEFEAVWGRTEKIKYKNKFLYLMLIKNPVGFDQVIHTLKDTPGKKSLLISINDNFADGTDISWLWDVDFEILKDEYTAIVSSGIRANDLTLRLKYAGLGIDEIETIVDPRNALIRALEKTGEGQTLYVLPTYTAMLQLRKIVKTLEPSLKNFWED